MEAVSENTTISPFRGLCLVHKKYFCGILFYKKIKVFDEDEYPSVRRDLDINKVLNEEDYIKETFLKY